MKANRKEQKLSPLQTMWLQIVASVHRPLIRSALQIIVFFFFFFFFAASVSSGFMRPFYFDLRLRSLFGTMLLTILEGFCSETPE